jgi:hypothetical protein
MAKAVGFTTTKLGMFIVCSDLLISHFVDCTRPIIRTGESAIGNWVCGSLMIFFYLFSGFSLLTIMMITILSFFP